MTFEVETEIGVKIEVSGTLYPPYEGNRIDPPEDGYFEVSVMKLGDEVNEAALYDFAVEEAESLEGE